MPDTKITALTALTAADPANDMMPIVDVSDTSMAASGTTKRISINNILACSPSATLASATITGDLTVATDRLKVVTGSTAVQIGATTQTQIGTTAWPSTDIGKSNARFLVGNEGIVINWNESSPVIGNYSSIFAGAKTGIGATTIGGLQIRAGIENASNRDGFCSFWTSNQAAGGYVKRYEIDSNGVSTWSVGGSTAMTLNSTGLGVGLVPSVLSGFGTTLRQKSSTGAGGFFTENSAGTSWFGIYSGFSLADSAALIYPSGGTLRIATTTSVGTGGFDPKMTLDSSGNVGIGVTPSAWGSGKAIEVLEKGYGIWNGSGSSYLLANAYFNSGFKYANTGSQATHYYQYQGTHVWSTAASGTAGNAITFTQAMTLDASGNLILLSSNTPATLTTNGQLTVNATSNTNLRFSYRGSDGTTRVANITLA